ncbi:MAG: hypothetical protein A2X12_04175 [Bacteroidetes bacterium GWE2_29_8]|nr:MAG: hypothetical protein A2X12_04175 [Bacteroidetes bacterium GWE2_29_8]
MRFVNNDPSTDSLFITNDTTFNFLDTTACYANNRFYHEVLKTKGDDNVKITINFDSIIDANWDAIANWTWWPNHWVNLGSPIAGVNKDFKSIARKNLSINDDPFKRDYFVLIAQRPSPSNLNGQTRICYGEPNEINYFASGDPTNKYHWSIYGGNIISPDTASNEITIQWENYLGEKNITVKELSKLPNCTSFPTAYKVNVYPKPVADFVVAKDNNKPLNNDATFFEIDSSTVLSYDLLSFINLAPDSNCNYFWDFSDGGSSSKHSPFHTFSALGNYQVMLLTTNQYGCSDTAYTFIDVIEGMYFPNVFTPNGDGFNDVFALRGSGMKSFVLSIFNRWGVLMYETINPYEGWDGKTVAGLMAPGGVYYYILNAKSEKQEYKYTGFVTLVK